MKTIGLIGGMSWESTAIYYRAINEGIRHRLGGLHSAEIVLYSVDFAPVERMLREEDWESAGGVLSRAARAVEAAGAEFLLLCTNTMHRVAARVEAAVTVPLLHIADATGAALLEKGVGRVGLLGTAFTMEQRFYSDRLQERFGLETVVPGPAERQFVDQVIFDELCRGVVSAPSREGFVAIIDALADKGAETVILGCTEIGMLVRQGDTPVPLMDTTVTHAAAAVAAALERTAEG